jgi:hypothetical protein
VQLEHGAGHQETGPWEVDIDHITAKCEDTESILIVAKVTGGVINQSIFVRFVVYTAVTMKNTVFWDIKTHFVLHRRHITSPLKSPAG